MSPRVPMCHEHDSPECHSCANDAGSSAGVDRRGFLLAAAALAFAACADAGSSTEPEAVGSTIDVSTYPQLANTNGVALVTVGGASLAIVRTGETSFLALSRRCPHQGATVKATSSGFTCPRHGARFSATGAWVGGERTSSLRTYPTQYDAATRKLTIG